MTASASALRPHGDSHPCRASSPSPPINRANGSLPTAWDAEARGFDAFSDRLLAGNLLCHPTGDGHSSNRQGIRRISRTFSHSWGKEGELSYTIRACVQLPGCYVSLKITTLTPGKAFVHRTGLYQDIVDSVRALQPLLGSPPRRPKRRLRRVDILSTRHSPKRPRRVLPKRHIGLTEGQPSSNRPRRRR